MNADAGLPAEILPARDQQALEQAVQRLEQQTLAIRVANLAGKPLGDAMKLLPKATGSLHRAIHRAMYQCLVIAIESRDGEDFGPSSWRAKALTGLSGGVGGFFGGLMLPLEMPLTITLMLRAIVDIAAREGEDLTQLEPRLACLQVFAMSDRKLPASDAVGYYAIRATLTRLTADVIATIAQRGSIEASAPVVNRLVGEVVTRFGFVMSERAAASALPIIGAVGGATVNVMFMHHFERIAAGHFTVRRLERTYGADRVSRLYRAASPITA